MEQPLKNKDVVLYIKSQSPLLAVPSCFVTLLVK